MGLIESLLFVPAIILLGVITSYEDIRYGKIRNKWIISGLIYSFIAYCGLISYYLLYGSVSQSYILELITNLLFAVIIGFSFFIIRIWTAGDGKLFIAFTALIPLMFYSSGYIKFIPAITLLINIFIISLIIIFSMDLTRINIKILGKISKRALKEVLSLRDILKSLLEFFALSFVINLFLNYIGLQNSSVINLFLSLIIILFFNIIPGSSKIELGLIMIISIARLILDKSVYSFLFLYNFIIIFLIFIIFRTIINMIRELGKELSIKEIDITELKPGMIVNSSRNFPESIDNEEIEKLKKTGIKKVKINQTIPFAPLMFLGVIITLIIKGNLIFILYRLFIH